MQEEWLKHKQQYYILADTSLAERSTYVLKIKDSFAIFDKNGNIRRFGFEDDGFYFEGTRFVSRLVVKINGKYPLILNAAVKCENDELAVDLTNPDFETDAGNLVKRGSLHLLRSVFLTDCDCYEQLKIANFALEPLTFTLSIEFDAGYTDIFEVRGIKRERRGEIHEPLVSHDTSIHSYTGLDQITRYTDFVYNPPPTSLEPRQAIHCITLEPLQTRQFSLTMLCRCRQSPAPPEAPPPIERIIPSWEKARKTMHHRQLQMRSERCKITTSNEQFNHWLNRSFADLSMMLTETEHGLYPYAGIPWFNTFFGRDGLITAMETLWFFPDIAKGVLAWLAAHQAQSLIPEQDAEPGKILHEQRKGELVNLGEIPFGYYYGSIDSSLLFIILAGHYYSRTNDRDFIEKLWPALEMALAWIDNYGDIDGDGFVEYQTKIAAGLTQQGWKDSEDSVFHANGELAKPPIALCEVQGYVYDAKVQLARLARVLGKLELADRVAEQAKDLKIKFHSEFWLPELGTYALALDCDKQPCKVRSSNAGQCLFTKIAPADAAREIVRTMTDKSLFSGWGIRTIAHGEPRYNPMSCHNGCIWPHDNAMIAAGMRKYGYQEEAMKVLAGLFDASIFVDFRLPELFCGFERRKGEGPILYPVACIPQAWAAVFLLLQACLGIEIDARERMICFHNPVLPPFLEKLKIENLSLDHSAADIELRRLPNGEVNINVVKRNGSLNVLIRK